MTKDEFDALTKFPKSFVSICRYEANGVKLKRGHIFVGVGKTTLGKDDHSILDQYGHPHHISGCNLLFKDDE